MISYFLLKSYYSIRPYDAPELKRPEPPAKRNTPVAVVVYFSPGPGFKVFRKDLECLNKAGCISHKICSTVEIDKHPFVWVENEAVDILFAFKHPAEFREDQGCSRHCR